MAPTLAGSIRFPSPRDTSTPNVRAPKPRATPQDTMVNGQWGNPQHEPLGGLNPQPRQAASRSSEPPKTNVSGAWGNPKYTPWGGITQTPAPASGSSSSQTSGGSPSAPSGPPAGAPDPGTPDTSFPIPLVASDEQAKQQATSDYNNIYGAATDRLQGAASAYGDPTLMASLGLTATPNPNSALAMAALRAQLAGQANTNKMTNAGTVFSSLNLQNQGQIAAQQQRSDLAGYQRYQNALAGFNKAIADAVAARDNAINNANLDERNTAIANLPTASTSTGGFAGSTNQGRHMGKPSKVGVGPVGTAPRGSGRGSGGNLPKVPKPSRTGKGSTSVRRVSPVSIKKVGKAGKR